MDSTAKILIVDDSELIRVKIHYLLLDEYEENNIFSAATIEEAWEILNREKIDVVLLDIYLPGKNGADLINDMLSNEQLKDIPIIVITGTKENSFVKVSYGRYVYAYLHKPIDKEELLILIKNCLLVDQ